MFARAYRPSRLHSSVALVAIAAVAGFLATRASADSSANPYGPDLSISVTPLSGNAPLTVSVTGKSNHTYTYFVDLGDGESFGGSNLAYMNNYDIDVTHTYACPGTYRVFAEALGGTGYLLDSLEFTVVVDDVAAPAPSISARVIGDTPPAWMVVVLQDEVSPSIISRATVDWGDGSPLEDFVWYYYGGVWMTPNHDIDKNGSFVVTITNYYLSGDCTLVRTASTPWSIGVATATEATTWGRIKALYGR